ncbi:hypothetical protein TNCV_1184791 [Trichonephila clavipes]|nr:hypothetical protein TNCV_1184791 [Trichonephila clavipes]
MVWGVISSCGLEPLVVFKGDDHRRPLSKHSRRSSSPYASDTLSGRTSCVLQDEYNLRVWFPPPRVLSGLETALHEE